MKISTNTTDFLGTYDWPQEEGRILGEYYLELISEGECVDYIHKQIMKDRAHWVKVFGTDEQGVADMTKFRETVNSMIAEKINIFM